MMPEELFRTIVETTNEGVWLIDPQARTLYVNQRMADLLGESRDVLQRRRVHDYCFPEELAAAEERIGSNLRGRTEQFDFRFRRRDGGEVLVLACTSPVRDAAGQVSGALGMFTDVTARKHAEQRLKEESRRKDELLAVLAHELRNPLVPIRNAAHLLRLHTLGHNGRAGDLVAMIDRQVGHMSRLVDDLLDVARVSRGHLMLRKERIDLCALISTTVTDHRDALLAKGILVDVSLPAEPVYVLGDPVRLQQALGNLLENAGKFTEARGRVSIELGSTEGRARISVRDTGIGITKDLLPKLFTAFAQGDRSLDRTRGGLGLGLALVKGLIELHDGHVTVASAGPGQGADFTIDLPLLVAAVSGEAVLPAEPPRPDGQRRRVLIIEDNRDIADSLSELVREFGHEALVAHTGPAGLAAARGFHPEIVLCDIGLPGGMDGYTIARTMRRDPLLSGAYLVALTGYGQDADRSQAFAAGFDLHLTKPFNLARLEQLLSGPLESDRAAASPLP
jgi:PAS domain S-box-containing protein